MHDLHAAPSPLPDGPGQFSDSAAAQAALGAGAGGGVGAAGFGVGSAGVGGVGRAGVGGVSGVGRCAEGMQARSPAFGKATNVYAPGPMTIGRAPLVTFLPSRLGNRHGEGSTVDDADLASNTGPGAGTSLIFSSTPFNIVACPVAFARPPFAVRLHSSRFPPMFIPLSERRETPAPLGRKVRLTEIEELLCVLISSTLTPPPLLPLSLLRSVFAAIVVIVGIAVIAVAVGAMQCA